MMRPKKRLVGVNVDVERSEIPANDKDVDIMNEEVVENLSSLDIEEVLTNGDESGNSITIDSSVKRGDLPHFFEGQYATLPELTQNRKFLPRINSPRTTNLRENLL